MKPLILIIASLLSFPAAAQNPNCAQRDAVVERLNKVGETQDGIGLGNKGSLLEIWTSEATGTWTVVMTFTDGTSCIMAYGENWTGQFEAAMVTDADPV